MRSNKFTAKAKGHWEQIDYEGQTQSGWVNKGYKAYLEAEGYTQQEAIDYENTFSPVVRFVSIRLIIVAYIDLKLYQIDIKMIFLNGRLDKEIYMDQPMGFVVKG